jgi:mannose-6-phosphate isomerase-like protein (cupin superfamily)
MSTLTAPLVVEPLAAVGALVPHAGILTPGELEQVARDIAARSEIWQPRISADRERRRYALVYEDERMDAWVLSWMPGQATGFHDHYISSVGLAVAQGRVREDQMRYGKDHVERSLTAGDSRQGDATYIHRIQHTEGEPAVTIHVYSPPLEWVGQYRLGDDGVMRREPAPGRNELRPQLIAAGALHGVLEHF